MGNGGCKREVIREYVQDPQLVKQLEEMHKTNAQLVAQFGEIVKKIHDQGLETKIESFEDLKRFDEKSASALVELAKKTEALQMKGRNFGFFWLNIDG